MTTLETKTILITVKAYPSPSRKYGETVCCAGIDIDTARWIRLYPIPFRDLDTSQKFKKYTIIRVRDCKEIKCINGASGKWCSSTRYGRHQV